MAISDNLKRLRENAGLSQPRLAELSGVSQQLISQIESGKNATTKKLPQLARALQVSVYEIDPNFMYDPGSDGEGEELSAIYRRLRNFPDLREMVMGVARQAEQTARRSEPRGGSQESGGK